MYEEELAAAGLGGVTLGAAVLDLWWVVAIGAMLLVAGLALAGIARRAGSDTAV